MDLAEIMDKTESALIGGICLDTCHAFQAGYEISKGEGVAEIAGEIERHMGLEKVKLIHLNDSKKAFNSRVDRHEHIGSGAIGTGGLKRFINHPAFRDVPLILETPKKSEDDDPRNLKVVRSFLLK
ncbi:MAG: deoxyribonuclease IV [Nitrospirae bacterium]|nr:deoxyribonuclease IV [Nitrospirota bacterium]